MWPFGEKEYTLPAPSKDMAVHDPAELNNVLDVGEDQILSKIKSHNFEGFADDPGSGPVIWVRINIARDV